MTEETSNLVIKNAPWKECVWDGEHGAKNIMDWVIDRDPEAGRYWRDDIGRGVDAYDALLHRLQHDPKAHSKVYCCRTKAVEYLRSRGFPVH